MIELRDFVAESLKQIIDGVASAQDYAKTKKALINPERLISIADSELRVRMDRGQLDLFPQLIEFDIAITASEGIETKAGFGIFAAAIGAGAQAKSEDANSKVSRLKFSVPVLFPQQPIS